MLTRTKLVIPDSNHSGYEYDSEEEDEYEVEEEEVTLAERLAGVHVSNDGVVHEI